MFEITNVEGMILQEIADKRIKRDSLALSYALCIKSSEPVDFAAINRAILGRYSMSGLTYIKERAWKIVNGKVQP